MSRPWLRTRLLVLLAVMLPVLVFGVFGAVRSARADTWVIVPGESSLGFRATQMGSPFDGKFDRWEADIVFAKDRLAQSRIAVVIDMASATTGNAQRDAALPDPAWFDAAAHPQARFQADTVQHLGGNRYRADGTLTIKGTRRPVELPFSLETDGTLARVQGALTIDRTDFDVGAGSWAAGDVVGHDVTILVDIMAQSAAAATERR